MRPLNGLNATQGVFVRLQKENIFKAALKT